MTKTFQDKLSCSVRAQVMADSLNPVGDRLITMAVLLPRFVLAQLGTHRMFSRSSASSRAVPMGRFLEQISLSGPCMPLSWLKNGKGMSPAGGELDEPSAELCEKAWTGASEDAIKAVAELQRLGLHKQSVNRLLEPFLSVKVIISATHWGNFFALRCHKDAQEEISALAWKMLRAYRESTPKPLQAGQWHLPLSEEGGKPSDELIRSVARCARASYQNFFGKDNPEDDRRLHNQLIAEGHFAPFEHQGEAMPSSEWSGNFRGFRQYRKTLQGENRHDYDLNALWANRPKWLTETETEVVISHC